MTKLPISNELGFYEIRMESVGGFGANLAGKILGEAGVLGMGFNGSNFSSYGSEKKGSPVKSFVRFCDPDVTVRINTPITEPHMLVIFVETMIDAPGMISGAGKDTTVIVNTHLNPDDARDKMKLQTGTVVTVDAMKIAIEEKTRVNTALLGTLSAASGFIDPEVIKEFIRKNLGKKYAFLIEPNLKTFDRGYKEFQTEFFEDDGKYPAQPFRRDGQKIGYMNQPLGGVITTPGNSIHKDLTVSRSGWVPVLIKSKCTHCGECDITCPDYCFVWSRGKDKKGKEVQMLESITYKHCKGCLRCVDICKFDALESKVEYEVDPKVIEVGFRD
ncbi:Pyruvate:ferredoxin oxidoreductase, gamma subunit / Pyruvate:ferredoxin oxidoreductase, delta subunit [hydrothermal vent metagenome]|uniref:Pyruvate:ferredoxin oxidoreductase, gamma subunit / Pyruvate:ferredoxin oxidoreductase, delta subunit n=1 Tax=hydrothermal vent metagenome TaxID=652676 RepID=A0A3B1CDF9_9ZZZZ